MVGGILVGPGTGKAGGGLKRTAKMPDGENGERPIAYEAVDMNILKNPSTKRRGR